MSQITTPRSTVWITRHDGPRDELRELFEMAEDSPIQLNAYINDGDVLVAHAMGDGIVGHLQLVPAEVDAGEIKNTAVTPRYRRQGVGTALIHRAIEVGHRNGWKQLFVRTATADTANLRFYQKLGFRCIAIEPDAFTPAKGYPAGLVVDGIPLRDGILLSLLLGQNHRANGARSHSWAYP